MHHKHVECYVAFDTFYAINRNDYVKINAAFYC